MRNRISQLVPILLLMTLSSCKGKKGDTGPKGAGGTLTSIEGTIPSSDADAGTPGLQFSVAIPRSTVNLELDTNIQVRITNDGGRSLWTWVTPDSVDFGTNTLNLTVDPAYASGVYVIVIILGS